MYGIRVGISVIVPVRSKALNQAKLNRVSSKNKMCPCLFCPNCFWKGWLDCLFSIVYLVFGDGGPLALDHHSRLEIIIPLLDTSHKSPRLFTFTFPSPRPSPSPNGHVRLQKARLSSCIEPENNRIRIPWSSWRTFCLPNLSLDCPRPNFFLQRKRVSTSRSFNLETPHPATTWFSRLESD